MFVNACPGASSHHLEESEAKENTEKDLSSFINCQSGSLVSLSG